MKGGFIGRIPLWATLVPLVLGVLLWGWVWRGYADSFRADLQQVAPPGTDIALGGFPYRLEARIQNLDTSLGTEVLRGRLQAKGLAVNRVPWQTDRQVLNLESADVSVAVAGLSGATARVEAAEAQASLKLDGAQIARLSVVWEAPRLSVGLLPGAIVARHLEVHLRETPSAAARPAGGTALPTQAQIMLSGDGVRFGAGDPLTLAVDSEVTGPGPLTSYALWARGGAVEIRSATLSDAGGEVARLTATLGPDGAGALRITGRIETICPASVRAVIAGQAQPVEKRSRKPQTIALSGRLPGGLVAAPADPLKPPPPVRAQEAPCPRLR